MFYSEQSTPNTVVEVPVPSALRAQTSSSTADTPDEAEPSHTDGPTNPPPVASTPSPSRVPLNAEDTRSLLRSLEELRDSLAMRIHNLGTTIDRLRGQTTSLERYLRDGEQRTSSATAAAAASAPSEDETEPAPFVPIQILNRDPTPGNPARTTRMTRAERLAQTPMDRTQMLIAQALDAAAGASGSRATRRNVSRAIEAPLADRPDLSDEADEYLRLTMSFLRLKGVDTAALTFEGRAINLDEVHPGTTRFDHPGKIKTLPRAVEAVKIERKIWEVTNRNDQAKRLPVTIGSARTSRASSEGAVAMSRQSTVVGPTAAKL